MRSQSRQRFSRAAAAVAAAGLIAGLMVAGSAGTASAATAVEIHQGDFIPILSDTRSAGHYDFTADGIHLWTDNATARRRWPSTSRSPAHWRTWSARPRPSGAGTDPAPGSQLVFDADDTTDGNDYNILVGESVYGGTDWWLTSGSSGAAKAVCPETGGGFGSACHGTWRSGPTRCPTHGVRRRLQPRQRRPRRRVITSLTFGATEYGFVHGLGACDVSEDYPGSTFTLTADCVTDRTLWVRDGRTVDGAGHKITATETDATPSPGRCCRTSARR